ncbi:hypothetical protein M2238_003858 [Bradyrhizobium elkanii]|nr:hypothetical protein [Bradyrhizobium elkanii]
MTRLSGLAGPAAFFFDAVFGVPLDLSRIMRGS